MTNVISQSARSRKRVLVTFDEDQVKIIQSLKGFGTKDAEIVRSIVTAYLSEARARRESMDDKAQTGKRCRLSALR